LALFLSFKVLTFITRVIFMGRIRTTEIKKAAKTLYERFPGRFTKDFEQNKQVLKEMNLIEGKRDRNKVAGYLVRVARQRSD
jgi:small subunit ribosomal protein S17e